MKSKWQMLAFLIVAGVAFYLGTIVTKSKAQSQQRVQSQEKTRDEQGRFVPVPQFPMAQPKASFGVTGSIAFRVNTVDPDSPAQQLGIQSGDLIVRIDEKQFYSINDWRELLSEKNPGDTVAIDLVRGGDQDRKTGQVVMTPLTK